MAAAAAGTGTWAAQEKQFPPALLSFFIYNPRFGPREGEVRGGLAESGDRRPAAVLRGCRGRPGGGSSASPGLTEPLVPGGALGGMWPALDNAGRSCQERSVRLIPPPGLNVFPFESILGH